MAGRRALSALLALLAATALGAGCGSALDGRGRPLPAGAERPAVFAVTNEAQAPLVLAGAGGALVTVDAGRTFRGGPPDLVGAVAGGFSTRWALFSTGRERVVTDLAVRRVLGRGPWPFRGEVRLVATSLRSARTWLLVTGGDAALVYTNDDGESFWPLPAVGLCARPQALAATAPTAGVERLYVACGEDGLLVSDDLGASFRRLPGLRAAADVTTTAVDPRTVVVAAPLVEVSRDGGRTWRRTDLSARRVALDPRNADLIVAIGFDGGLRLSTDGGETFGA